MHCENENLVSLIYLHTGSAKVWYVIIAKAYRSSFEDLTARDLYDPSYSNKLRAGDCLAIMMKYTITEPLVVASK